ncbi:hypothetical protein [Patiriisocius marinus]|uniref:hypothetical protein n=1 Tax=Patiriisocius marinus TaxID=1397112 RepID=UPI00232FDA0A|nr:hypothetical protein [Patiriisocius marinus]
MFIAAILSSTSSSCISVAQLKPISPCSSVIFQNTTLNTTGSKVAKKAGSIEPDQLGADDKLEFE